MSPRWPAALSAAGLLIALCSSARATANQDLLWAFQDTGVLGLSSGQVSLAMTPESVWPVIFTNVQSGSAFAATPTGNGKWQPMGTQLLPGLLPMRTASSIDGRLALFSTRRSPKGSLYSPATGWSPLPVGTQAAAFDQRGNPVTATPDGIAGLPRYLGSTIVDMAISSAGDIGIVDSGYRYWQYSASTGDWLSTALAFPGADSFEARIDSLDLEFDSLSRPHLVGGCGLGDRSKIYALDFSTITGAWHTTLLTSAANDTPYLTLAANHQGEVATVWIKDGGDLMFSYKPDNGDWVTSLVASDISWENQKQLGLAFDEADNPVIAYVEDNGHVMLAYNPNMLAHNPNAVPEPACLALLSLAGLIALRRHH
ncbi:MAG TPA: hypothetical protein VHP11_16300 [Tepidisphaeraceae bacterium]|nr:hypothetical protein [Tepidisphaeraceae bacterium]